MTRKEFLRKSALMGLASPFLASLLSSCSKYDDVFSGLNGDYNGKVLIIGAGAAGMTAGYILARLGVDYEVLEAAPIHGGRVKRDQNLADFPIDTGAEWIHTTPAVLAEILQNSNLNEGIEIVPYSPETLQAWNGTRMVRYNAGTNVYGERKFRTTTWFGFFDQYMMPLIRNNIRYNSPVSSIDYSGAGVAVRTQDNTLYEADKVLCTVPLKILQEGLITFTPDFPTDKNNALDLVSMPPGFKAFIRFSERFYPDMFSNSLDNLYSDENPRIYYDGAFRKSTQYNILGLFSVGEPAGIYSAIPTDAGKIAHILDELDTMYNGRASATYIDHVIQDWTNEPWVQGSYSFYPDDSFESLMNTLTAPLDNKVYFAGEAYSPDANSTVNGAAMSSYTAMQSILAT